LRISDPGDKWKSLQSSLPIVFSAIENNPNVCVQDFLDIHDTIDASVISLNLSIRALNCLRRENVHTVHAVLQMPLLRIATMRNAGSKTITEILNALKNCANIHSVSDEKADDSHAEIYETTIGDKGLEGRTDWIPRKRFALLKQYCDLIVREEWDTIAANLDNEADLGALLGLMDVVEVIGPEMVVAALQEPRLVSEVISSFQEYIDRQRIRDHRRNQVKNLIEALPNGRAVLPVMPFLNIWSKHFSKGFIGDCINDDRTCFLDLEATVAQVADNAFEELTSFLSWCKIDIKEEIEKVLDCCIKNSRQDAVLQLRGEGDTLEAIGMRFDITRERVRQIEAKALRAFIAHDAGKILHLISAERNGDEILTADEIKSYCGDDGNVMLHLLRLADDTRYYRYSRHLDSFVLRLDEQGEKQVQAYVDDLPDRIESGELDGMLEVAAEKGLISEQVALQIRADYNYIESIQVWQRGKLNIRKMCKQVLATYDPDGIYVYSADELFGFRDRLSEMFGSEARISEGNRALTAIICAVGMLRNRGTYVSVREHILSDDLLSRIKDYIESGSSEVYMFSTIYDAFMEELLEAGVDNRYYLQGILRHEWDGIYAFSRDCLSRGERATNIYGVVEEFVKKAGGYVYSADIREAFPGVSDSVLNLALLRENIIACNGKYIHADNLYMDNETRQFLHSTLESLLSDGLAHHSNELYSRVRAYIGGKLDAMGITYQSALFSVMVYLFGEEYVFSRPWIAQRESTGEAAISDLRNQSTDDEDVEIEEELPVDKECQQDEPRPEPTAFSPEETEQTPASSPATVSADVASRWNQILSEEFEDGLRLNGMRLRKFRGIYEERFHEQLEADDEKLIEMLKQVCDYRDERVYAKKDASQNTLLQTIHAEIIFLLTNGASGVYPQQIFEKYQAELADQMAVYTVDALKSMLQTLPRRQYSQIYGVFCLPGKACNPRTDVVNLFQNCYVPLTYAQMSEQLWYLPLDRIKHELVTEPSVVNIDQETYFYAPNFPISTHELAALQHAMQQRIEDEGYLVAKDLRELMQTCCPNAVMDTVMWKDWGIRNAIAWLLRDHFEFNGIVICAQGAGLDTHEVFRIYCRTRTYATIDDIKALCTRLDVTGIYWDSVFDEMVRISKKEFVSRASVHFDIEATDRALESACHGDYMALKDFVLYMTLPGVEHPWNGYLLESYLRRYSRVFCLNQAGPTEHTYIGAMVKRTSAFTAHRDLLTDVLAHDDTWETEKEAFGVLRDGGYRSYSGMANSAAMIKAARVMREKLKKGMK